MTTSALEASNVQRAARLRRFKPYPAYKDSGVEWLGEIPAHWECKRLKLASELNPPASEVRGMAGDTEVSFVPMEAVGEYGGIDLSRSKPLADVGAGYTYFRDGDVVVAKITPCFENGKGALAAGLTNGIAFGTTELHVFRATSSLNSQFLFYVTLGDVFRRLGEADMYGAGGQKRVSESFFRNLKHPLPTLPEQRAIAAFLDRATARIDGLVAKKERLIALLQEKRTALITRAATKGLDPNVPMKDSGVEWLGEIPAHWAVSPLGFRYNVQLGKMLDSSKITGHHLRHYLRVFDVQWGTINTAELPEMDFDGHARDRFRLAIGDLLVNEGGSYPGRSAIWKGEIDECYYQKALHRLRARRPQEDFTQFMYYVMYWAANQGVFVAGGNETTIEHLPAEGLRRYHFAFPPPSEQRAIAAFLDRETARIASLVAKIRDATERLKELRTALISAAVTGKIDVREEVTI